MSNTMVPPRQRRRRRVRRVLASLALAVLAAGAVVIFGTGFGRDPSVVESALIDQPAPPLSGPTVEGGGRIDIDDYRGTVVLVNVWASWCEACRSEHPALIAAQEQLGPNGLQIIGINMSDTRENAQDFLATMGGNTYPSVYDPDARHAVTWGTFAIPETYLIDRDGIIVEKATGPITAEWITQNVAPMLDR